jgi:hypothetical protein
VSDGPFDLHVLPLSEDDSLLSLRALTRHMLRLVDPSYQDRRVDLEPEGEEAQRAMQANLAQSLKPAGRRKLVTIARAIAHHIFDERGFVLLHVDADQAWSDRLAPSKNIRWFHDEVTLSVSRVVDDLIARNQGARDKAAIMSRLHLVSPYWCIESWLYQNTAVARALCHKHHRGLHADVFEHWEHHRGELDEVDKPKDQVCLGSKPQPRAGEPGLSRACRPRRWQVVPRDGGAPAIIAHPRRRFCRNPPWLLSPPERFSSPHE